MSPGRRAPSNRSQRKVAVKAAKIWCGALITEVLGKMAFLWLYPLRWVIQQIDPAQPPQRQILVRTEYHQSARCGVASHKRFQIGDTRAVDGCEWLIQNPHLRGVRQM